MLTCFFMVHLPHPTIALVAYVVAVLDCLCRGDVVAGLVGVGVGVETILKLLLI